MDAYALGLINAANILEDGRIDTFVKERYASFSDGIGKKIVAEETSLEELATIAEQMGKPTLPGSGKQEYLRSIINEIIF